MRHRKKTVLKKLTYTENLDRTPWSWLQSLIWLCGYPFCHQTRSRDWVTPHSIFREDFPMRRSPNPKIILGKLPPTEITVAATLDCFLSLPWSRGYPCCQITRPRNWAIHRSFFLGRFSNASSEKDCPEKTHVHREFRQNALELTPISHLIVWIPFLSPNSVSWLSNTTFNFQGGFSNASFTQPKDYPGKVTTDRDYSRRSVGLFCIAPLITWIPL